MIVVGLSQLINQIMKYTTIRTKTLVSLKQFYQEALNPRYCINGIYHIKLSNWFPIKQSPSINKTLELTLNSMFERITPVEYKTLHKNLTFDDFFTEYKKQHLIVSEIRSEKYKKSKAKKNNLPAYEETPIVKEFTEEDLQQTYEELESSDAPLTMYELIAQNTVYLKRMVELMEENRTVQRHCIENTTANSLKILSRLINMENLLTDYLK